MKIIEYIGKTGIKSSEYDDTRMRTPRPGDVVDFGENCGTYPFTSGRFGRLANFESYRDGHWAVCCGGASVFLYPDSVDISGGPFTSVRPEELEPTYETQRVRFWNWGDNVPGAAQGVDYYIDRPVFRLKKRPDTAEKY